MIEIANILCPVDLSPISRRALEYALMLARWYGSKVTVLEVVQTLFPPTAFGGTSVATLTPAQLEDFERELDAFAQSPGGEGLSTTLTVQEGQIVPEILQEAHAVLADLIVMGTHGRSGFEHLLLGSVTAKVLRKATCPVFTVPPACAGAPARPAALHDILCPVDFSPASLNALAYALSLAEESEGRLTLLHVFDWPLDRPDPAGTGLDLHAHRRHLQDDALRDLRAAIPADARNWCETAEVVAIGKPYEAILAEARGRAADLIVMGVHGRRAVDLHVFGSTTDHVIREARCPVLTIHP
jgi:nucleotide-binding universal stress UspA family protein